MLETMHWLTKDEATEGNSSNDSVVLHTYNGKKNQLKNWTLIQKFNT